ncbi:MAG: SMI1/KNR4 family protein [Lachnospiraceae bacterium]|nr:SMI1/KNR4 family protein [Lachnospiraceae bacterium]
MNIIGNINKKLIFDEDEICAGGENDIEEVIRVTPVPLPEDYIEFLKQISGEDSYGPEFEVEDEGLSIWIWSAKMALEKSEELNRPSNQKFMSNAWLFGNDLGDLVYFFGTGKDGFGLYRTSAGCLDLENAEKISDTLTDFLVHGVGIDIATGL